MSEVEKRSSEEEEKDIEPAPPEPAFDPPETDAVEGPVEDPTDAPDLTGSAISYLSRFGLAGSVIQIVGALAIVVISVTSPGHVSLLLGRVIGGGLMAVGLVAAWIAVRERGWRTSAPLRVGVFALAVGGLLVADPERWLTPIGWVVGGVSIMLAIWTVVEHVRHAPPDTEPPLGTVVAALAVGAALFVYMESLFEVVAVVGALLVAASGIVDVGSRSGVVVLEPEVGRRRPTLVRWVDSKGKSEQHREDIYGAVFFEGSDAPARISRFMLMMLLASVISAAGVVSDSTAVVIGAMLVAPLINPMMGIGLSLATGWPNRLGRSSLVVLVGTLIAIGTAWVVTVAADVAVDLDTNSQIVSRSSPRLIDLLIAVAAGAAGAYALSRKDALSSLPGVAVAIALVPPLSVVGVTAQGGDWEQASGTLLLFLTNVVAIIVAGSMVFVLTGVVPLRRFAEHQHRVRTAAVAVGALAVIVIGGLVINGRQIAQDAIDREEAERVVAGWLGDGSGFEVISVDVDDGVVAVVLAGPGKPPSANLLARDLNNSLTGGIRLDLQWITMQRTTVPSR